MGSADRKECATTMKSSTCLRNNNWVSAVGVDFVDTTINDTDQEQDRAPVRRWAVAHDDSRLVFAAEGGLKLT